MSLRALHHRTSEIQRARFLFWGIFRFSEFNNNKSQGHSKMGPQLENNIRKIVRIRLSLEIFHSAARAGFVSRLVVLGDPPTRVTHQCACLLPLHQIRAVTARRERCLAHSEPEGSGNTKWPGRGPGLEVTRDIGFRRKQRREDSEEGGLKEQEQCGGAGDTGSELYQRHLLITIGCYQPLA
jgi:hypothetical protein